MVNMIKLSSKYLDEYWIRRSLKLNCSKKFLSYPEPYEIGNVENGKLLLSGVLKFQNKFIKQVYKHLHFYIWANLFKIL